MPLNIGFFVAALPPDHLGGAEIQAERLSRELAKLGHTVHIFARQQPHDPAPCAGVRIHRRPVLPVPGLRALVETCIASFQARRAKLDVVLCFITLNSGLLGWATALLGGPPFVIWVRGVNEVRVGSGGFTNRLKRFLFGRCHELWLQAECIATELIRESQRAGESDAWRDEIKRRLRVMPNGLDARSSSEPQQAPTSQRFCFIGRLVPEKQLPVLFEAVRQHGTAELVVVGSGPLEKQLRDTAGALPIRFLGSLAAQDVRQQLLQSRALILSSSEEGMPNAALEALANARPVIATAVGALPEIVQHDVNGFLVPVGDATSLAQAMRRLQDDGTWVRLARAAPGSVARFDWSQMASQVDAALSSIVAVHN